MDVKRFLLIVATMIPISVEAASDNPCAELAKARSFSFFAEVAAGTPLSGERAFARVLHLPNRLHCLTQVVDNGTNEARMYALAALRELSPRQYRIALTNLSRRRFTVTTLATEQQGVLRSASGDTVLSQIEAGKYRRMVELWRKHELPPQSAAAEVFRNQMKKLKERLRQQ